MSKIKYLLSNGVNLNADKIEMAMFLESIGKRNL
jgi:hypothetical protein